jgi:hypothetical protein
MFSSSISMVLFVRFRCLPLYSLGCLYPVFKGVYTLFLRVQRKRTSSVFYGERKGIQSLAALLLARLQRTSLFCSQRADSSESRVALRRVVLLLFVPLFGCVKWLF